MNYKKLIHKEYISLLQNRDKSLFIATYQNKETLKNCYNEMELLLKSISIKNLTECYNSNTFIKLINGNKRNMIFLDNENSKIYSDLSGQYYTFNFKGFDFIISVTSDENLKTKNFKLYTINLSFLKKVE
jgi:hypothetical protein